MGIDLEKPIRMVGLGKVEYVLPCRYRKDLQEYHSHGIPVSFLSADYPVFVVDPETLVHFVPYRDHFRIENIPEDEVVL